MYKKKLIIILVIALVLRFVHLENIPYFPDLDWFFASASSAFHTGHLPMLGITSSVTWLHQGPLWTYLLLVPLPPIIFTFSTSIMTVALVFLAAGGIPALIMAVLPFAIIQTLTPYHTALIPLFFFLAYLNIVRRHSYLSGLFIGFLYQLHLLTFIYWPLFLYLASKKDLSLRRLALGFILGILPFIISGPVQTFGIFVWLIKQILTGFDGVTSGISTAYWVVLMPGLILVLKWIYVYWNRFNAQRK